MAADLSDQHHPRHDRIHRIDGISAELLGATMFALLYGLIEGSTTGWTALPVLSLVAGVVLFAGFAARQRLAADPLILPSLLANRGFTAGLLLGLAFFSAVNGLAYVVSLFFQTAFGLQPSAAAGGLARSEPVGPALALSLLVFGVGMGACFSSIYDVAIGDVAPDKAGSASGALSAVQQLASGVGSAVVTTIYFTQRSRHGSAHAMVVSVAVVGAIALLCLGLVWLLPKSAPPEPH